jgi:hypothetical protein
MVLPRSACVYSLFILLSISSIFFFIKAGKTNKPQFWIILTISNTFLIFTHYFGFLLILIEGIIAIYMQYRIITNQKQSLVTKSNKILLKWIISTEFSGIAFLPWFDIFKFQTSSLQGPLSYGLQYNSNFFLTILEALSSYNESGYSFLLTFSFVLIIILGIIVSYKKKFDQIVILSLWFFIPILIVALVTLYRGPTTTTRNFIFVLPAFILLISNGIVEGYYNTFSKINQELHLNLNFLKKITFLLFIGLILTCSGFSIVDQYSKEKGDWRGLGEYLNKNAGQHALIILNRDPAEYLYHYYSGNSTIISIGESKKILELVIKEQVKSRKISKFWFIASPDFGISDSSLKEWLDTNCLIVNKTFAIWECYPETLES